MHGEGNLLAHLVVIGYKVSYQQVCSSVLVITCLLALACVFFQDKKASAVSSSF